MIWWYPPIIIIFSRHTLHTFHTQLAIIPLLSYTVHRPPYTIHHLPSNQPFDRSSLVGTSSASADQCSRPVSWTSEATRPPPSIFPSFVHDMTIANSPWLELRRMKKEDDCVGLPCLCFRSWRCRQTGQDPIGTGLNGGVSPDYSVIGWDKRVNVFRKYIQLHSYQRGHRSSGLHQAVWDENEAQGAEYHSTWSTEYVYIICIMYSNGGWSCVDALFSILYSLFSILYAPVRSFDVEFKNQSAPKIILIIMWTKLCFNLWGLWAFEPFKAAPKAKRPQHRPRWSEAKKRKAKSERRKATGAGRRRAFVQTTPLLFLPKILPFVS